MPYLHHILSRALNDRFQAVSNPIKMAHEFCDNLLPLCAAANQAFEKSCTSIGGAYHYIMDMNEAAAGTVLRPDPKSHVFFMTLYDTSNSKDRSFFAPLPEPGLILSFTDRGAVTATTTKNALPDDSVKKIRPARTEICRVTDHNRLEGFIASWLRINLDSKTMVAIQGEMDRLQAHQAETFHHWSPKQLERMQNCTLK